MDTAKMFWTGRSQAIRLPKNFRFDATRFEPVATAHRSS